MDLFRRHIGLPPCADMDQALTALANKSRQWYRKHGQPWSHACSRNILNIDRDAVILENGYTLRSSVLAQGFKEAGAHAVAIVAVSAGARVDEEIDRLWKEERPDEAMFLAAYAAAVAEDLRARAAAHLGDRLSREGLATLPHYSPGYDGWDLSDQAVLFTALDDSSPLELLPSGGLRPKRSALAAYGITRRQDQYDGFWFHRHVPSPRQG